MDAIEQIYGGPQEPQNGRPKGPRMDSICSSVRRLFAGNRYNLPESEPGLHEESFRDPPEEVLGPNVLLAPTWSPSATPVE